MYYPDTPINKADLYAYTLLSNLDKKTKSAICRILYDVTDSTEVLPDEHKCPVCHKVITEPIQLEYLEGTGTCLGCDTLKGDIERDNLDDLVGILR